MSGAFDAIVVGGGVMGTAAAREPAERGLNTLLLERFTFGHNRGSSGGPTRIFRFTYEHPDYVRMAGPALDAWRGLEDVSGERLLHTTGGIDIGEGARRSADALEAAGAPFAWLTPDETMERWAALLIAPDRSGPDVDPDARSFEPDPERLERLAGWASKRFLPLEEARPPETCLYTNTLDGEFLLDRLGPIVVGSPYSGHGFKFAPLIGRILADMATGRPIGLRLDAFRAGRDWTRRHMMDRAFDA